MEGLLLPPTKRTVLLIMKRLDRSIFLTPRPWLWYRCVFRLQPEAGGRSSGLESECHLGRRGVCRNWSMGVDYNRRKPKYKRGMLMEVQKIEVLGGEYYGVALRGLGRSYSPLFKYSGGLGNMYTYFPQISNHYTSTQMKT